MEIENAQQPEARFESRSAEFKTPDYTSAQITELRSRLGQSRADFARAMGVALELVYDWQDGLVRPSPSQRSLMARLAQHADEYSEKVALRPALETALRERKVDQIHASEFVLKST
jgi:DNA-binding transcriptional regulator YiaG